MSSEFTRLITALLKEWAKYERPGEPPLNTYSKTTMIRFVKIVEDWAMFYHCSENRKDVVDREQREYEEWMEENIDRLAEENDAFYAGLKHRRN